MRAAGRLGDKAQINSDAHGCPGCPHSAVGPAIAGSPNVDINTRPALRVGDRGMHSACCGSNSWTADGGAPGVFINGKSVHRQGDRDRHCGGMGQLAEGSPNVFIGDRCEERRHAQVRPLSWIHIRLVDQNGEPIGREAYEVRTPEGLIVRGRLNESGEATLDGIDPGHCEVKFPHLSYEEISER